jgi:hypothetical protein
VKPTLISAEIEKMPLVNKSIIAPHQHISMWLLMQCYKGGKMQDNIFQKKRKNIRCSSENSAKIAKINGALCLSYLMK